MTPNIREEMRSTIAGLVGCLDLTRTAVLETTVSIACSPAAFIVSPDSIMLAHLIFLEIKITYQQDLRSRLLLLKHRQLPRSHSAR